MNESKSLSSRGIFWALFFVSGILQIELADEINTLNCPTGAFFSLAGLPCGHVQLARDFGKRLRAAISCHLTQTSKESA